MANSGLGYFPLGATTISIGRRPSIEPEHKKETNDADD
jgi:hypothetical protein